MRLHHAVVGCDISKNKIDLVDGRTRRHRIIDNTAEAIDHMLTGLAGCRARFAFESTGFYDHELRKGLARHGMEAVQIQPLHARRFAQSCGKLAKTDRIDAMHLASMADLLDLAPTPTWNEGHEKLKALITRPDQLVSMRSNEMKHLRQSDDPGDDDAIIASIKQCLEMLSRQIATIEAQINTVIADNTALKADVDLLQTVPGIGATIAATLAAFLPEAGSIDRRAVASLAGLAPAARDSGTRNGRRFISGGRPQVRRVLYLAALTASRGNTKLADKYRRLIANGKPPKLALIALARAIATTINAMLKTKTRFA